MQCVLAAFATFSTRTVRSGRQATSSRVQRWGPTDRSSSVGWNAKGFTGWEQFVAMLFCQVAHLNSLREVCLGLAGCESPLKHLGISTAPKKSTLAYANANR